MSLCWLCQVLLLLRALLRPTLLKQHLLLLTVAFWVLADLLQQVFVSGQVGITEVKLHLRCMGCVCSVCECTVHS